MNHTNYVNLLRPARMLEGGSWADFGAGAGSFTFALRELVGRQAVIHAVDRDQTRLRELGRDYQSMFGEATSLRILNADFSGSLALPPLDGVLMANSLHFFKEKKRLLRHVGSFMKPGGLLLLVEYNVDRGNMWVPYPLSFPTWEGLAPGAGFSRPRLLATSPSSFLREFYSAACVWIGEIPQPAL